MKRLPHLAAALPRRRPPPSHRQPGRCRVTTVPPAASCPCTGATARPTWSGKPGNEVLRVGADQSGDDLLAVMSVDGGVKCCRARPRPQARQVRGEHVGHARREGLEEGLEHAAFYFIARRFVRCAHRDGPNVGVSARRALPAPTLATPAADRLRQNLKSAARERTPRAATIGANCARRTLPPSARNPSVRSP